MPKPDYRIPPRRERELSKQVRDLQARLDSLSKDPSATLEISRLEGIVAERDAAIAGLESELESERARTARLRGELAGSRAKRKELELEARQLKCDVGNERARTRSAQSNYERMAAGHARLLDENRSLKERNSELEAELARKDALIEHLNARLSRGPENSSLPPSSEPNRKRIPNSRVKTGRKPGGQPRHPGHARRMPEPDDAVFLEPESGRCLVHALDHRRSDFYLADTHVAIAALSHVVYANFFAAFRTFPIDESHAFSPLTALRGKRGFELTATVRKGS